jgi:hypothetical protein
MKTIFRAALKVSLGTITVGIPLVLTGCNGLQPLQPLDPGQLIYKIVELILNLLTIFFGFLLLNAFWNRREGHLKALPLSKYFLSQVEFISRHLHESYKNLQKNFVLDEQSRASQRDELVYQTFVGLENLSSVISKNMAGDIQVNYRTAKGFAFFLTHIYPDIRELVILGSNDFRSNNKVIDETVNRASRNTDILKYFLEEEREELNKLR